jgi:Carboxypeptidase regulatory-like domain
MKCETIYAIGIVVLALSAFASADTSGTIRGTVVDSSGAVLQKAHVSVLNEGTNESRSLDADANGGFQFVLLPVGTYTLRVEQAGFESYVLKDIPLAVNQVATFSVTLKVGASDAVVDVHATAAQVDTANTQLGTVIDSKPIVDLPLNGRNVYQLVALQPGINVGYRGNSSPAVGGLGSPTIAAPLTFSAGGGRLTMNNFMVDGIDANNASLNQAGVVPIPDAVQEFRVLTSTYNAEFGRNSGSIVNVITKSGTNHWHGDLFEFFRNDKLNASNFFESQTGQKASYKLNQFGGTLGGPVRKNKTFVFGSLQISRERRGALGQANTVYSNAQRGGDFSADSALTGGQFPGVLSADLCLPRDTANCTVYASGTPYSTIFPGGQIPTSMFDPVSLNLLTQFIPRPNNGAASFVSSPVQPHDTYQWTIKIDQEFSANQKVSGFYYFNNDSVQKQSTLPGFPTDFKSRGQQLSLRDLWLVSPMTLNEFGIGFLRQRGTRGPAHGGFPSSFGFSGIQVPPPATENSLPEVNIASSIDIGGNGGVQADFQSTYHVFDNFSKLVGHHAFKFGGDYRLIKYVQPLPTFADGFFSFKKTGGPNTTGDAFADFVLGLPTKYAQGSTSRQRVHSHEINLYAQDTWQIAPTLTVNYGLRWELNTPWVDKNNELNYIQPPIGGGAPPQSKTFPTAPPGYLFGGDPGVPRGIMHTLYRDFAPRIGLAFSPSWLGAGKLVIRSAYGIFYNPIEQFVMLQLNGEPPFAPESFVSNPGFATPFVDQSGASLPNPFPFVPPAPGSTVDFSPFFPIVQFGELLPNLRSQYVEQYNLSVEYQLSPSMVLGAAYVGSQGHRLLASYDANHGDPNLCFQINANLGPGTCGPNGEDSAYPLSSGQTVYGTRPFGAFANNGLPGNSGGMEDYVDVIAINSISQSSYNSGQFRLERRGKGLSFLASYTFSKAMDNASGFQNLLNPYCYKCDLGLSSFDARHHFIFSYTYELPLKRFARSGGLRQKLIGGWEVGGIYSYQSGSPIFLTDSGDDQSLQGSFDGFNPPDRPDLAGPIHKLDPHQTVCDAGTGGPAEPSCALVNRFFDPAAFTLQPLGQIGNARHNFFAGSPVNNLDFTAIKRTSFGERYSLEFRTEIFNLLNHAQFFNPVGDFSNSKFGDVTAARDPRFIQFGMKLNF